MTATSEMMMMRGSRWKKMIEEGSPGRERERAPAKTTGNLARVVVRRGRI